MFRKAISTETGVELGDADGNILFDEIGLDPITRFSILDIVADRTGVELPASLFRDCCTLSEVAKTLSYSTSTHGMQGYTNLPLVLAGLSHILLISLAVIADADMV